MPFFTNAEKIAREEMIAIGHPELVEKFATVIRFLELHPKGEVKLRKKDFGSLEYFKAAAAAFANSRIPKSPEPPTTVPDEMVSYILKEYFNTPETNLKCIQKDHQLSMAAENMVGDLLERYLAESLEPKGWIWISGSLVKGADFLKPPDTTQTLWQVLQVKNRDNSENSSSSAIRKGTDIKKWFRTFSKKQGSNWDKFPDSVSCTQFSEEGFKEFVRKYLLALPKKQ